MPNWERWLEDDNKSRGSSKKPNKNFYCRKNKLGNKQYGPHEYKEDENACIKCGHIRNKQHKTEEFKESEDKNERDE